MFSAGRYLVQNSVLSHGEGIAVQIRMHNTGKTLFSYKRQSNYYKDAFNEFPYIQCGLGHVLERMIKV